MVTEMLYKNTLVKIRKSFGRFLSLFIIVLVGAGFFAGIQASAPDAIAAISAYNNGHKLTDFQIVSTMGLTNDDAYRLRALQNVSTVVPSYFLDVLDHGKAIRVHAIEESVNEVKLVNGRMPQSDKECVADSRNYKLGDEIIISSDVNDKLKNTEFTVVGTVQSPLYMSYDYGNTTVGDGKLSSFIFVNRDNFTLDVYTEIYLQVEGTGNVETYSQEYNTLVSQVKNELINLKPDRENARYLEIYNKAADEISSNASELNSQKADGEKKLSDAKAQLDENQEKLVSAKAKLTQNELDLNKNIQTQTAAFKSAKEQIASGRDQIDAALQQYGQTKDELPSKTDELNNTLLSLKKQQNGLASDSAEYAQLEAQISKYTDLYQQLFKLQASLKTLDTQEAQLRSGTAAFNAQITDAKKKIDDGKLELSANQKKLDDGYSELNSQLSDFNAQIADAQAKIQEAGSKLSDIEKPQWTIFDRDTAVAGYSSLKSGTDTITSVVRIFPIFFILIVLLMTSNTMARMITEERGELGTLASLGFKDRSIISTYLFYVLTATVLGVVIGYFGGCTLIPKIIYACFPYSLPPIIIQYSLKTFLLILAFSVAVMTAVTIFFCNQELKGKPAALMRPVSPKSGESILLERIGFIWKRMSFTWKVTMRNLFRYKQRVAMTVVGIAGCTALLLTGFGIKDSINGVAQRQYGGIFKYNDLMVLKNETQSISGDLESLLEKEQIQNPVLIRQSALSCDLDGKSLDAYLIVPENENAFSNYFSLKSVLSGADASLDDSGVIITKKLSETYKIQKGDTIAVKDADNNTYTLPVSDVAENHISDYVYMSKNLYEKIFAEPVQYNIIVSDYSGSKDDLAKSMIGSGLIVNVNFRDDMLSQAEGANKSLDNVIVLLVCIASILMVIVLYNLTSINISERKREIATLKVLGFTDKETNEYIYREAMGLSLISIAAGLLLGIGVHRLVMDIINENAPILFFVQIKGLSFVWTALLTAAVSAVMQVITYFKLQTIDMIESLKSVE